MSRASQLIPIGYAHETCAWCGGIGHNYRAICPACGGKGNVIVHQPPKRCPMCGGDGKNTASLLCGQPCVLCGGRGWALALKD